jgi:hypothetical protein
MTKERALSADTARATALEDSENKIKSAFRRGLEATCAIAKELVKIHSNEWYTVRTEDWNKYITDYLRIDLRSYRRIVAVSQTVAQLQDAGLELPANETQAAELSRLEAPLRARVWNDLVIRAEREEKTLTVDDVRRAVDIAEEARASLAPPVSAAGVEVDMDFGDSNGEKPAKKARVQERVEEAVLILTEKGEAALNRIRKICGDIVADAISSGAKAMTERDIRNWAEYDDSMMRMMVYCIMDRDWSVSKAVNFVTKEIDDSTDVGDLLLIASSRGGSAQINYENRAKITIELKQIK